MALKRHEVIERIEDIIKDDFVAHLEGKASVQTTSGKIVDFLEDIGYDSAETLVERLSHPELRALNDPNASWNLPK